MVLALIAERTSGVPFHDLVSQRVCEPAGMIDTEFLRSDALPERTAVGYIDRGASQGTIYNTARRPSPNGPEFVLFTGSGYGNDAGCSSSSDPCEGRTFYTLDALSGDVIAAVDVGARGNGVPQRHRRQPGRL
jgi:CubicO group peptidase (beta-lactamase class C family)